MNQTKKTTIIMIVSVLALITVLTMSTVIAQTKNISKIQNSKPLNDVQIYLTFEADPSIDPTIKAESLRKFEYSIIEATQAAIHPQTQLKNQGLIPSPSPWTWVPKKFPDGIDDHPVIPVDANYRYTLTNA
jgi:hypothetical protein